MWRRRSRSQARTAWWCELAWPGQAAHPAGRYKYSHLSPSVFSPSELSRHQLRRRHRHHGLVWGPIFFYRNQMRDSAQGHVLQLVEAFLSRLATYKPTCMRLSVQTALCQPRVSMEATTTKMTTSTKLHQQHAFVRYRSSRLPHELTSLARVHNAENEPHVRASGECALRRPPRASLTWLP